MYKSPLVVKETKDFSLWHSYFDIGSLTALLTISVSFHGSEKSCLSASEKNHFDTKWSLYNVQFAKQCQKISILPSQKGVNFPGGWGVL